jgi:hypothetical protein
MNTYTKRLEPDVRRGIIIAAAVSDAKCNGGIINITHGSVAAACPIETSKSTVLRYFPLLRDLYNIVCDADEALAKEAEQMGYLR